MRHVSILDISFRENPNPNRNGVHPNMFEGKGKRKGRKGKEGEGRRERRVEKI